MPVEKVQGLYTIFYIKYIYDLMSKKRIRWYIDDAGTLWHINDARNMLQDHLNTRKEV